MEFDKIPLDLIVLDQNVRRFEGVSDLSSVEFIGLPTETQGKVISMARSIDDVGLLHPVVLKGPQDGKYFLRAGFHRYWAFRYLGRDEIPATIISVENAMYDDSDESHTLLVQLTENIHRSDLNPMDIAQSIDTIRMKVGIRSVDSLAKYLHKSEAWVRQHLSCLYLADEVKDAIRRGELGISAARQLASKSVFEQTRILRTARKEAKDAGDVDSEGNPIVKIKGLRRQARRKRKDEDLRQQTIRPVVEREQEQRQEVISQFIADEFGQGGLNAQEKLCIEMFWNYLFEKGRVVIY